MVRYGCQTPSQSVILDYKKTLGQEAIDIYKKTGLSPYPWQEKLIKDIFAVNDDGLWTHSKFGYAVPRRNGKTEIVYMAELWFLMDGKNIIHTAHRISTSHSSFKKLKKYLEKMGMVDKVDFKSIKAKGQEMIELIETGGVIQFRTRTETGGLGEGFDLLVIDEAQEYTKGQESALKYTVSDSDNPMILMCGTPPTLVSGGTVFSKYRDQILGGGKKHNGWAEWSVGEKTNPYDVDAWYKTNPSMGYKLRERAIEEEIDDDDELDFNIQRLGYWVRYNQKSAISELDWNKLKLKSLPILKGNLNVGIKYGKDGDNVALAVGVKTLSRKIFVEVIDCQNIRNGNYWIVDFLSKAKPNTVVIDGASGQEILSDQLKDIKIRDIILPTVREIIVANSMWEQGIYEKSIVHMDQPSLSQVVTNCEKRNIGSSGGFGYRSQFEDMDISLMDACLLAHWACREEREVIKQKIYY
ncbi:DEAD/DEAH box helicase family protein [Anaerococcus marasmi]|uniref:DEAD/DEAH box helicase family protein n=1 Tax=Anaerococcus marasmi TaxID=2057797 RepID=UPI000CF8BC62|nr:DEAD/DEAH box helicase family protein [Anaerococcus marasmi]